MPTDKEIEDAARCLVWCDCHGMVRQGGMCSPGFCNPERLSPECPVDRALIAAEIEHA